MDKKIKHEEMHFIVQKGVGNRFRQIMKKTKLSSNDLFEEMVETHANGLRLDSLLDDETNKKEKQIK